MYNRQENFTQTTAQKSWNPRVSALLQDFADLSVNFITNCDLHFPASEPIPDILEWSTADGNSTGPRDANSFLIVGSQNTPIDVGFH